MLKRLASYFTLLGISLIVTQSLFAQAGAVRGVIRTANETILNVGETLLSSTGGQVLLRSKGIQGDYAIQAAHSLEVALKGIIGSTDTPPTSQQAINALQALRSSPNLPPNEVGHIDRAILVLRKNPEQVSATELGELNQSLVYLNNVYFRGNGVVISTCGECPSQALRGSGFRTLVRESGQEIQSLTANFPQGVIAQRQMLREYARDAGFTDMATVTRMIESIDPAQYGDFATALRLVKDGSTGQRELAEAIIEFSTPVGGQRKIVNPRYPNSFWEVKLWDLTPEEQLNWANALRTISRNTENIADREEAFFRYFDEIGDSNPRLRNQADALRANNCFFGRRG